MNAPVNPDALFRAQHIGASEVAALFDASPWITRFELFHRKTGTIATPDFNAVVDGRPENERIYFGVKLEPIVVEAACERWGYLPAETPHKLSNGAGLGGHPDKIVTCPERGRGILEVKTADWLVAKQWGDEPPLNYLLQAQTYAGLAGAQWADLIVLVGGNELRRFQYEFRPALFAEIKRRVAEFWQTVERGIAPKPDYARDGSAIVDALGAPDDAIVDLSRDNRAQILAADIIDAKAQVKALEAQIDAAKAELFDKIGTAGTALLDGYRICCGMQTASPGKLVTEDMIGTYVGARKAWRRFDLKEKK